MGGSPDAALTCGLAAQLQSVLAELKLDRIRFLPQIIPRKNNVKGHTLSYEVVTIIKVTTTAVTGTIAGVIATKNL